MKIQPVILAGGNGYRLWPLSDKIMPKQFVKYFDDLSSFQNTVLRNKHLGEPLIIANIKHKDKVEKQLSEISVKAKIIFEPKPKNTFICALVASCYSKKNNFDSISLIPSDHHITNQSKYNEAIIKALNVTKDHKFATIGIKAEGFNKNFGYIKADNKINNDIYLASEFIEKPKQAINDSELYFWNSGIYFFDIDYFLSLASKFSPSITDLLKNNLAKISLDGNSTILEQSLYDSLPTISFDDAISVNLEKIAMVKAGFKWNDLGSWETVCKLTKLDKDKNNIIGKVITHNVKNSYINSDAKQTVAIDLEDTIVVFKNGQLFISRKDGADRIKKILLELV